MNVEDSLNGRFAAFTLRIYYGVTLTLSLLSTVSVVSGQFLPPTNGTCACLNQNLTYTCTVEGSGATIWKGDAFECAQNRIVLRNEAISGGTAIDSCNDGNIIARGVGVRENRFYISKLVANVSNELSGSTISCELSSGGVLTPIGSAQVNIITGPYQLVPAVRLAQASDSELRFNWTSLDPTCSAISYEMTTSGCGTCTITTNTTTASATCTGWQLGSMCAFSVQSVICGFTGMPSNTVAVAIRVPDPPQVDIVPVYSADTNSLAKFFITIRQIINSVANPPIMEYIISYSGGMRRNNSCMDNQCEYEVSGPFQDCATSSSSTTSVTVSASNVFGQGVVSGPLTFGCTNQLVEVSYTSSAIVCTFLNSMDTSVKSCTVLYGSCGQELIQERRRAGGNSTVDRPNLIEIQLDPSVTSLDCFMFAVTASNDTYTVIIVDTRSTQSGSTSRVVVIAITVTVVAIGIVLMVAVIIMIIIVYIMRNQDQSRSRDNVEAYAEVHHHSELTQSKQSR